MPRRVDFNQYGTRLCVVFSTTCKKSRHILLIVAILAWIIAFYNLSKEGGDHNSIVDGLQPVNLDKQTSNGIGPSDWTDPWYCDVKCSSDLPCMYNDEVDFRVIVMTYQRKNSLKTCLESILNLDTLGDKISVEIWIDRSKDNVVDHETVVVAENFRTKWQTLSNRRACVHIQSKNAYIGGQWINTWRPKAKTSEIALILEDDVDISPFAYKWLKVTHRYFHSDENIAGYTLQMQDTHFFAPLIKYENMAPLKADASQTVFLYPVIGTWGYAPHPEAWRKFQDWYHTVRPNRNINSDYITPNVPGIIPNGWYNAMQGNAKESMWEMWHIKFTHDHKLFTVYSNMKNNLKNKQKYVLSVNRKEKGLHFSGKNETVNKNLLVQWNDDFVKFPAKSDLVKFNYHNETCNEYCCFSAYCGNLLQKMMKKRWSEIMKLMIPFAS